MITRFCFLTFLFVFFIVFPFMLNHPPMRIVRFWEKKGHSENFPKFLSCLLAISMVAFNTLYYACNPHSVGIWLSSILMFSLFSKRFSLWTLTKLCNNDKYLFYYAIATFFIALVPHFFPVAILMGLVLFFTCMMPKPDIESNNGLSALEHVAGEIYDFMKSEETSETVSCSAHKDSIEVKEHKERKQCRTCRPNRHSNGSNYKKSGKVKKLHFDSNGHLKTFIKSSSKTNRNYG